MGTGSRAQPFQLIHEVRTGVAAEAVAYLDRVIALTQGGDLVVVDPATGAIVRRRRVGYTLCASDQVAVAAGRAVFVTYADRRTVRFVVADRRGAVRTATVRLPVAALPGPCRIVSLSSDGRRVLVVGQHGRLPLSIRSPGARATLHRIADTGKERWVSAVPGGLGVGGRGGLRVYDTGGLKLRCATGGSAPSTSPATSCWYRAAARSGRSPLPTGASAGGRAFRAARRSRRPLDERTSAPAAPCTSSICGRDARSVRAPRSVICAFTPERRPRSAAWADRSLARPW